MLQVEGVAAGHPAPGLVVNAEHCKEIYDRLQTPRIKHKAKLRSAGLNQTQNPSSFSVSHDFPQSVFLSHLALSFCTSVFPANITINFICQLNGK